MGKGFTYINTKDDGTVVLSDFKGHLIETAPSINSHWEPNTDLLEIKETLERKIGVLKELEKETVFNEWYVARRDAFEEVVELINCYILEDEE